MYLVLTGGQHPFEELEFKNERDKSFADVNFFSFFSISTVQHVTECLCS